MLRNLRITEKIFRHFCMEAKELRYRYTNISQGIEAVLCCL